MAEKWQVAVNLACSFCGKPQDEVRKLIVGPTVFICYECIDPIGHRHGRVNHSQKVYASGDAQSSCRVRGVNQRAAA